MAHQSSSAESTLLIEQITSLTDGHMSHKLDLLDNAMDSLEEALKKFEEGDGGDQKAYKFCVLHMSHFIELIFKHHITEKHPLLIYANPFAPKIDVATAKTIGLWEAVNFINNEDKDAVAGDFKKDLEWLKRLRNDIEHHKFDMDVPTARITIGRLFRSVLEFLDSYSVVDVEKRIPNATTAIFRVLSDEYQFKLHDALKEADKIEEVTLTDLMDPDAEPIRMDCEECNNNTMVVNEASGSGYRCTFCGNESGDDLPASCSLCGQRTTSGELYSWHDEFTGSEDRCYLCSGRYAADNDRD
jgi:ribosomal protein S27E